VGKNIVSLQESPYGTGINESAPRLRKTRVASAKRRTKPTTVKNNFTEVPFGSAGQFQTFVHKNAKPVFPSGSNLHEYQQDRHCNTMHNQHKTFGSSKRSKSVSKKKADEKQYLRLKAHHLRNML
jgi:hypothetical protein